MHAHFCTCFSLLPFFLCYIVSLENPKVILTVVFLQALGPCPFLDLFQNFFFIIIYSNATIMWLQAWFLCVHTSWGSMSFMDIQNILFTKIRSFHSVWVFFLFLSSCISQCLLYSSHRLWKFQFWQIFIDSSKFINPFFCMVYPLLSLLSKCLILDIVFSVLEFPVFSFSPFNFYAESPRFALSFHVFL